MKYYLHDSNAFQDEKVTEIYMKFGYEGVGLFYVILEKLASQEKPIKTSVLKSQLKIGKRLNKCWNFMEQIDIISSSNGETFSKQLLNFSEKYIIKKEKNRKKISEWRERQQNTKNVTSYVPNCNPPKVKISKVKISKDIIIDNNIYSWINNFSIYKESTKQTFMSLEQDKEYIAKLQTFYPNCNIITSIRKGYSGYWGKETGWHNKIKAAKKAIKEHGSYVIDWKTTLLNNLEMSRVFYTKEELKLQIQ